MSISNGRASFPAVVPEQIHLLLRHVTASDNIMSTLISVPVLILAIVSVQRHLPRPRKALHPI